MTNRRTFTKEFKLDAIQLAKSSGNVTGTARDLCIASIALWRWKKQNEEDQEQAFPPQRGWFSRCPRSYRPWP